MKESGIQGNGPTGPSISQGRIQVKNASTCCSPCLIGTIVTICIVLVGIALALVFTVGMEDGDEASSESIISIDGSSLLSADASSGQVSCPGAWESQLRSGTMTHVTSIQLDSTSSAATTCDDAQGLTDAVSTSSGIDASRVLVRVPPQASSTRR